MATKQCESISCNARDLCGRSKPGGRKCEESLHKVYTPPFSKEDFVMKQNGGFFSVGLSSWYLRLTKRKPKDSDGYAI